MRTNGNPAPGTKPMLLTSTDGMLTGTGWYVQPKIDGHRVVFWSEAGGWQGYFRSGRRTVTGYEEALSILSPQAGVAIDCELTDSGLWLLDFVSDPNVRMVTRYEILAALHERLAEADDRIQLIDNHVAETSADWVLDCRNAGLEGVVFKHGPSAYKWAGRSPQVRKLKFWRTAVLFVETDPVQDRAELRSADGYPVGAVGTAGRDVASGQKWAVRYLRFGTGDQPALREPTLLNPSTESATTLAELDSDSITNIPPRFSHA